VPFVVLALWITWRRVDIVAASAAQALIVCSYFVLSAQVHENHFWPAIPLLILGSALSPLLRWPAAILTILFAGNLAVFYGFGRSVPVVMPREVGFDFTVLLSIAIVTTWGWFARRSYTLGCNFVQRCESNPP
jgi:hypothetical protein